MVSADPASATMRSLASSLTYSVTSAEVSQKRINRDPLARSD
ncbi:MAG: hypothetical protein AW10_04232 [Candidatus Accumulibacter appositus]|uniref:Uncharacterized protein n=1 Tax=Candidatus Accumulibacter appositus TaxID=1454003 RepID=A0A011Q6K3_9PROT|nr:MAG: hypothetical protein AW10_04232 [Candidatus Accumulibacter appositus]